MIGIFSHFFAHLSYSCFILEQLIRDMLKEHVIKIQSGSMRFF